MQYEINPEKKYPVSYKRWKYIVYKNREKLFETLVLGITALVEKAAYINLNATSLRIIYTRTSVLNNRPYYRLYLFDDELYNGNTDCWIYWEMPDLMSYVELMFPIVEDSYQLGNKPSVKVMEEKRMECAEKLYIAMREMVAYFLNNIYMKLPEIKCYSVFFGEYMSEQKLLFESERVHL